MGRYIAKPSIGQSGPKLRPDQWMVFCYTLSLDTKPGSTGVEKKHSRREESFCKAKET
ncbi:hypothetical protein CLOSTMETH_02840 [[Clostridium] methylpentosum DSM 5476]|uniref:Uncharacterized protein n=1 Tax=[Clostridium] methylpentosum DSM 5476 TaxID=537013 RepID=C0EG48_9FIRM|nr:hypothetical protein CLOSTMETH_02840 [[Clostridium] methylpentosum DSM 5476]